MRTFIAVIAVLTAGFGVFFSVSWVILVGAAALVVAVVTGALAAPATRQRRCQPSSPRVRRADPHRRFLSVTSC
ncbi:hypothetical protein [Krasilnikovia sp. M28-CT-15]|uniref:hypothetical protein n=1 Tax=Krasilnikovia sp. M28-CT-15 TaxID=3373540 RepID=UPI003875B7F0